MSVIQVKSKIGRNELIIETGRMAKQADGAVCLQYGGTVVLIAAVCSKEPKEGGDFLPLYVEYQERTYAAGKIPGGFFKREGRPSEKEILTSRLIDRPIRSLFDPRIVNEIQIFAMVLSSDGENDPDILAMIGASAALSISNIPFDGPMSAVRVGLVNDEFVLNPTYKELETSSLDLVISGTKDKILMIEAGCNELSEDMMHKALEFGHKQIRASIELQEELIAKCSKPKRELPLRILDKGLLDKVRDLTLKKLGEVNKLTGKEQRQEALAAVSKSLVSQLVVEGSAYTESDVKSALYTVEEETVRRLITAEKRRVDGRGFKDIRPITCEISVLPRTHGSGLFTRGQTQSLSVTTLGTKKDEQRVEGLEQEVLKNFMLHYNFPPFSVGEVKPIRGPGRREIGHGALAERALRPVMPPKDKFPYTVRLVSDILESNGSSSMATVCGCTLSLMDAGVPIKAPVAGIAIGLITDSGKEILLTDIAGVEDHYGDMDFKVAGTQEGITAIQLDLKIRGVTLDLLKGALYQAKEARQIILEKMKQAIQRPKDKISDYAPRITMIQIKQDVIKDLIGPGGKTIKKIIADTGVSINVEDTGMVQVASTDEKSMERALETIRLITGGPEVGKIYLGKITRIMNFGAFCEIFPGKEGLIHVSEMAEKFVKSVESEVKIGDEVMVKVIEIDDLGRINLSRKQAIKGEGDKDKAEKKR